MLDALETGLETRRVTVEVTDPLGRHVDAQFLRHDTTAYVESAQAIGLHLVEPARRDVMRATTFGLGQLLMRAAEAGARTIVVGLGGSVTNDGGAGMLTACGMVPRDASGQPLPYGGGGLRACTSLTGTPLLRGAALVAATDVDNTLCGIRGASAIFGPQKGADDNQVQILDAALEQYARVLAADVPGCPPDVAQLPGAGAAGGVGAALYALGATRISGAELVSQAVGLDEAMDDADLVITGEGSFDHQSLDGKLVSMIARAATERAVACTVIAGQVRVGRREAATAGVDRTYSLAEHYGSVEEAKRRPREGLEAYGERIARRYHPLKS